MPFDGLLEYMLEDFGIPSAGKTRAQRLFALNHFLIERRRAGQTAAVIVDEAQNLSPANLEHLRLLSNFETPTGKLLQIILVGQPELREKLSRPELRQLRQRIGMRCEIRPLTADETREYIKSRLRVAGAADTRLFSDAAVSASPRTRTASRASSTSCATTACSWATRSRRGGWRGDGRARHRISGRRPAPGHARGMFWRPAARPLRWLVGGLGAAAVAGLTLLAAAAGSLRPARSSVNSSTSRDTRVTW